MKMKMFNNSIEELLWECKERMKYLAEKLRDIYSPLKVETSVVHIEEEGCIHIKIELEGEKEAINLVTIIDTSSAGRGDARQEILRIHIKEMEYKIQSHLIQRGIKSL
jgi:hypothetical protein